MLQMGPHKLDDTAFLTMVMQHHASQTISLFTVYWQVNVIKQSQVQIESSSVTIEDNIIMHNYNDIKLMA